MFEFLGIHFRPKVTLVTTEKQQTALGTEVTCEHAEWAFRATQVSDH